MAKSKKDCDTEYVLKKGGDEVLVEPCKGWMDPCEYCDKRFGNWILEDEDIYEKIPEKPGFFMIALKTKNTTEVVSISFTDTNINKYSIPCMEKINDQISSRKSKATKSSLHLRWMVVKKVGDKENVVLCAHWYNSGVLPKFTTAWPGMELLGKSDYLMLSKHHQKWCYAKKDPVWRKPKATPSKIVEEVEKCDYEAPCKICDENFTEWQDVTDVVEKNAAPDKDGLVMLSVVYGKKREVVYIPCDINKVVVNIESTVDQFSKNTKNYLREEKFKDKNAHLEVRWIIINDIDKDNACFLYAHFLNTDRFPIFNLKNMPGEKSLDKNKNFVLRKHDKKWMYEIEAFKQEKFSKQKNRRRLLEELEDDMEVED